MAGSLFDQLKKSGLVDEKKAKKVQREKQQQNKKAKANKAKKGQVEQSAAAKLAAEAAQQKVERDRQLNLERQQEQANKALKAELRQIIQTNQIKGFEGDETYSFADDGKVKSLNVNPSIRKKLAAGTVRIARFNQGYVLVADSVVDKIEKRDDKVLIALSKEDDSLSEEDKAYYAQFEIPDDLVW